MTSDSVLRIRHSAMGCNFDFLVTGQDPSYLRDAVSEAIEELDELERQMSVFNSTSEISYINKMAFPGAVRVEPRLFALLRMAYCLTIDTQGAFDITTRALTRLWNSSQDSVPTQNEIRKVLAHTGMHNVVLDEDETTVRFERKGIQLDLGAIGKGYPIRRIAELLRDKGVTSALLSAGNSTVYALGCPPEEDAWCVAISDPSRHSKRLGFVRLRDEALSVSGSHERYVEIHGHRYSHIIDPRTGLPVEGMLKTVAITEDPTVADALSTAFFVLGLEGIRDYCTKHPEVSALSMVNSNTSDIPRIICLGRLCDFEPI